MARIAGVDIPPQKRAVISLTYIMGIGNTTAKKLVKTAGINPDTRVKDLSEEEVGRLRQNIDRMAEIGSYRGSRHRRGLPVRGQRTRTNARSRRGPKRAVAGKKKVKAGK